MTKPQLIMLCGIPTSGKSSWVRQGQNETPHLDGYVVLSTDAYIDTQCTKVGLTYDEGFKRYIKEAQQVLDAKLALAIESNHDIIWDQTNLTVKNRASKLRKIPNHYAKRAVCFQVPLEEALRRNTTRQGKTIPKGVLVSMHNSFELPTEAEGFSHVMQVHFGGCHNHSQAF